LELSTQATKLGFKEKGSMFYFNNLGIAKRGKRNYMAILINEKFTCHVHSVLILDIFIQCIYYTGSAAYFHVIP